ncbi:peptide ABC transporter substrate-binding protein [Clostridium grantii]|uniref:Extracellular solute-binding protein, family 5 Middle n=1 Tax=Clostridium grantii DSM 8605 TaxID=1121316 RepID=A0A1M5UDX9_9CLOT|nr:peptide ABC transporter substrate-binding protein [Clostridium grantii]SHH61026.1 extracellular solute-binding protein, family 5 Middle [Clostridium grantii DSM 8605]
MKKFLSILLASVMSVALLAGCSGKTNNETVEETKAPATAEEVMKDPNVRKALAYAIDRTALVETVTKGGQIPATGFVPVGLLDAEGNDFRKTAGDLGVPVDSSKVEEAKQLLADAGYPEGKNFPSLTISYNTSEGHKAIAEAIQQMWKANLGIDVKLTNAEWAVFQEDRNNGNFELARGGWLGDYADPLTMLDIMLSTSPQNNGQWVNEEYDKLINETRSTSGQERFQKFYDAEKVMMEDMPVIPLYYYTDILMVKDNVEGWMKTTMGQFYFGQTSTEDGELAWNLGSDPKTLDPQLNSASDGGDVLTNLYEGLMRDVKGKIVPAMAESYEVSEDGLVYTFKLRDAKWSDGKAVTAGDFVFGWKRAMDPATASEYSFIMESASIKGAAEFIAGTGTADEVGVKALDDKTLEVTLTTPTEYFLGLTGFYTFMPVREDVVDAEGIWAKDPAKAISNGPFKLAEYKSGDKIVLVKNENYWNADSVKLNTINASMIVEESTMLTAYQNNELDIIDTMPSAEIAKLQAEDPTFKVLPQIGTYYYMFNLR